MTLQCAYCDELYREPASDQNYERVLPTHLCEATGYPTVYLPVPRDGFRKLGERKEKQERQDLRVKSKSGMMMNYGRARSREVGKDR